MLSLTLRSRFHLFAPPQQVKAESDDSSSSISIEDSDDAAARMRTEMGYDQQGQQSDSDSEMDSESSSLDYGHGNVNSPSRPDESRNGSSAPPDESGESDSSEDGSESDSDDDDDHGEEIGNFPVKHEASTEVGGVPVAMSAEEMKLATKESKRERERERRRAKRAKLEAEGGGEAKGQKKNKRPKNMGFARKRKKKEPGSVAKPQSVKKKPMSVVLERVLTVLKGRDSYGFFLEPVPTDVVTDYLTVIKKPMDFGTMEKKIQTRQYKTFDSFVEDFRLVYKNCMTYNGRDTLYYKTAEKLGQYGEKFLAREALAVTDEPEPTPPPPTPPPNVKAETVQTPIPTPIRKKRPYVKRQPEQPLAPGEKRKRGKYRTKQSIEVIMETNYAGDGSILRGEKDVWSLIPQTTPFERYINSKSLRFHQSLSPLTIPRVCAFPFKGLGIYVDPVHSATAQSNPVSEHPQLFGTLYGGLKEESYARSLLAFVDGAGDEVKQLAMDRIQQMTKGGLEVVEKVCSIVESGLIPFKTLNVKDSDPVEVLRVIKDVKSKMDSRVETKRWGTIDVMDAMEISAKQKLEQDEEELETWQAGKIRVDPLLLPALVGHVDNNLTQVLNSSTPTQLVDANLEDLALLEKMHSERVASGGDEAPAEEKMLRERVRRRLLTLVQSVPPLELANLESPPPTSSTPAPTTAVKSRKVSNAGSPKVTPKAMHQTAQQPKRQTILQNAATPARSQTPIRPMRNMSYPDTLRTVAPSPLADRQQPGQQQQRQPPPLQTLPQGQQQEWKQQ
ncbi:pre-mRNA-splicing factor prp46, partial [Phlyctochytrium planicorne]